MKNLMAAFLAVTILAGTASSVFANDAVNTVPTTLTLTESSHLLLDLDAGYVDKIDGDITVAELKANFASAITVKKDGGDAKADDAFVATDDTVAAADNSLKALIYGDVDRTGKINLTDVSATMKHVARWNPGINEDAADVDKTDTVNLQDASKLLKYIAGWDDISLGNVRLVFENTKLAAEHELDSLDLYFASSLIKRSRSNTENTGENAYKVKLARNETEPFQMYLASDSDMEGLTVEVSPLIHEYGEGELETELLLHYYYNMTVWTNGLNESGETIEETDYFPEVLLPLSDSFELQANKSQGFSLNVTAGKDAPAGMYTAKVTVRDADGNEVKCANIYAYLWDFTLPDTPYSKSSFGMGGYGIYACLGMPEGDDHKTHAEHYEFLLDHNVSSYQLPYPIMDSRADAYMSDPRVTSFEICGENLRTPDQDDPAFVLANFAKVQSDPVWKEKGHFYYVDEPASQSGADLVKYQHEYLTELLGTDDFDIILPHANGMVDQANNIDMLAFVEPYVDIHVVGTPAFQKNFDEPHYNEGFWTTRQAYNKYGESLPRLMALKENPEKELWWYTCIGPTFPYPNLFINQQGNMSRVIWWQQFMYDVEGFLYWATQAGWDAIYKKHVTDYPDNGDGTLMYLGEKYGLSGPVASWRLAQVRDGFDDFDYLRMAEELVGTEEVMKVVNVLTTGVTLVDEDPAVMLACRDAIAEIIVENMAK